MVLLGASNVMILQGIALYCTASNGIAQLCVILNGIALHWCRLLLNGIALYWQVYLVLHCMLLNTIALYSNHSENTHVTFPDVLQFLFSAHASHLSLHLEIYSQKILLIETNVTMILLCRQFQDSLKNTLQYRKAKQICKFQVAIDFTLHFLY